MSRMQYKTIIKSTNNLLHYITVITAKQKRQTVHQLLKALIDIGLHPSRASCELLLSNCSFFETLVHKTSFDGINIIIY